MMMLARVSPDDLESLSEHSSKADRKGSMIYLERGLFGAPMRIRLRCGFGSGLLIGGLEWIYD